MSHPHRKQAEAAQSAKLRRLGAMGSLKHARMAENAPRKYAAGGAVSDSGTVEGMAAKPRLDRPGRAKGKKGGKEGKGATVNIVIAGGKGPGGPPPMAGPPPDMPMPPPPGPGGPPMPMRKSGGAVGKFAKGGRVKREGGGRISEDSKREIERIEKDTPRGLGNLNALSMGVGTGAALAKGMPKPVRALGALVGAFGAKKTIDDTKQMFSDTDEVSRLKKGKVKDGEEDRKSGGRVGRKC